MAIRSVGLPWKGQFSPILKMRDGATVVSIERKNHRGKHAVLWDGHTTEAASLYFGLPAMPSLGCLIAGRGCPFVFVCSLSQHASHYGLLAALSKLGNPAGIAFTRVMRECTLISSALRAERRSYPWQRAHSGVLNGHCWN